MENTSFLFDFTCVMMRNFRYHSDRKVTIFRAHNKDLITHWDLVCLVCLGYAFIRSPFLCQLRLFSSSLQTIIVNEVDELSAVIPVNAVAGSRELTKSTICGVAASIALSFLFIFYGFLNLNQNLIRGKNIWL